LDRGTGVSQEFRQIHVDRIAEKQKGFDHPPAAMVRIMVAGMFEGRKDLVAETVAIAKERVRLIVVPVRPEVLVQTVDELEDECFNREKLLRLRLLQECNQRRQFGINRQVADQLESVGPQL